MPERGVHLQYAFEATDQSGGAIANPLFDLLAAVREQGSILKAAQASGASYRHVWGALKRWEEALGQPLLNWVQGQPARLTPFAERLLWAETRARARLTPHIEALRLELARVLDEAAHSQQQHITLFASHDLALTAFQEQVQARLGLRIDLRFTGSVDALQALAEGRCLVAGFHVPSLPGGSAQFARAMKPRLKPGRHKLIGCARRTQGLMLARGNPLGIRKLADLAQPGVRFINRQIGSGTRLLMEHLMAEAGVPAAAVPGWHEASEDSHIALAAALASGLGDAGPGIAAAAYLFGLHFLPLVEEDYYLVCLKESLAHPAVVLLREGLAGPAWGLALGELPGYSPSLHRGQVLSLTQALPWWRFRHPKHAATPGHGGPATAGAIRTTSP